jgi:hypothetical protein
MDAAQSGGAHEALLLAGGGRAEEAGCTNPWAESRIGIGVNF